MNEKIKKIEHKFLKTPFIKTVKKAAGLTGPQKIGLNRKGNYFFNNGNYDQAKRIFLATGYSDGIVRLGDHYLKKGEPFLALEMYKIAPAPKKAEAIIEKIALLIRYLIK